VADLVEQHQVGDLQWEQLPPARVARATGSRQGAQRGRVDALQPGSGQVPVYNTKLTTRRWKGEVDGLDDEEPLMRVEWPATILEQIKEHKQIAEEEAKKRKALDEKRQHRVDADHGREPQEPTEVGEEDKGQEEDEEVRVRKVQKRVRSEFGDRALKQAQKQAEKQASRAGEGAAARKKARDRVREQKRRIRRADFDVLHNDDD